MVRDRASQLCQTLGELQAKRVLSYRELEAFARQIGLTVEPGKGSHMKYSSSSSEFQGLMPIVIPAKRGDVGRGLGKAILRSLALYVDRLCMGDEYGEAKQKE